ncbi:MAG: amidohydrolase family protein, partial [Planctomycetota bacterium]
MPAEAPAEPKPLLLLGAKVLDPAGRRLLDDRAVLIEHGRITTVAPASSIRLDDNRDVLDLSGLVLIPGLIDLHTHLLLHPYDEASWNDQVLKEPLGLRTARAVAAAEATLHAGFTTIRDLGTEGAGYADVGIREAIRLGVVPGPRVYAVTRAIVATGCYGPSGFDPRWSMPKGAQVADGVDGVRRAVREQIAAGADWIKVYADYRRRPGERPTPTFSLEELRAIVAEANS